MIAVFGAKTTSLCRRRRRSLKEMLITGLLWMLMCVGVAGQPRTALGPRRLSLQSASEGACAVDGGGTGNRDGSPYNITRSSDFDLVPRNVTHTHLVFSANHRVEFDRGTLPEVLGVPQLMRLLMSVRYVPNRRLPAGLFVNLATLRSIQLYHDAPKSDRFSLRLSEGTFEGLYELVELQLARLGIEDLPTGVFRGLRSICRLDLSQNRLVAIRSDVFQPPPISTRSSLTQNRCCRNLTVLSLGRNRFDDVADIQLGGLASLRSVDLHGNVIASLGRDSFGGSSESSSGGFANIEQLNLGFNVIDHIEDGAFEPLARLRVLYLDGNMISNITAGAFVGLRVVQMDLGRNSMSELRSGVFAPLASLRTLLLAENAIKKVQRGKLMAKLLLLCLLMTTTLCLKKVPTFELSVILSNLKPIFKIFALLESV